MWVVPDPVLVGETEYESSFDMAGVETPAGTLDSGTLTNFVEIGQARDKILSLKLDQVRSMFGLVRRVANVFSLAFVVCCHTCIWSVVVH